LGLCLAGGPVNPLCDAAIIVNGCKWAIILGAAVLMSGDSCDGESCAKSEGSPDEKDLSDRVNDIAGKTGLSPKEVEDRIHKAKTNLPKGTGVRNPDVKVDTKTGEVYPKTPEGGIGDSIGNIFD
jgi:hypothetical protein